MKNIMSSFLAVQCAAGESRFFFNSIPRRRCSAYLHSASVHCVAHAPTRGLRRLVVRDLLCAGRAGRAGDGRGREPIGVGVRGRENDQMSQRITGVVDETKNDRIGLKMVSFLHSG
jgi:hypothetical protein